VSWQTRDMTDFRNDVLDKTPKPPLYQPVCRGSLRPAQRWRLGLRLRGLLLTWPRQVAE